MKIHNSLCTAIDENGKELQKKIKAGAMTIKIGQYSVYV